jgi:hypothetical protein
LEKCDKYYHQGKILKKDIIVSEEKTKIKWLLNIFFLE